MKAYGWGNNIVAQLGVLGGTGKYLTAASVSSTISWKQLVCEYIHTVGIDAATGLAYGWGYNGYGNLGNNSTEDRSIPTSVSSTISWKEIACGYNYFTLGIDGATGLAYAWGANDFGNLGTGDRTSYSVPTSVSSTISWKQIACGAYFTIGIDGATGLAYAWGANNYGQLGTGNRTSYSVPTSVSSTISWKQIVHRINHTVGIEASTGLAYAWGQNTYGQLGTGDRTSYSVPTSVSSTISWKQIACGTYHTIGIDASTGLAYGWGRNNYGQLGTGDTTSYSVPTSVSSAISWKQIACGNNHTVGIEASTGLAYAWGGNTYGELGTGDLMSYSVPTSVSSTISWKQIICGRYYSVGIDGVSGLAYGWGYNSCGEVGCGVVSFRRIPTSVNSTVEWEQVYCNLNHSVGIDASTGLAYAWGQNTYGQLGTGNMSSYSAPTSVSSVISWSQINCGQEHTLGVDASTGLAYAWGINTYGQLGTGDRTSYSVPTSISSTISWKQVGCGYFFSFGIDAATGLAYGWGDNSTGNLGTGDRTSYSVPTSVSSIISWKQISGGQNFTAGIDASTGLAYAWGYNSNGQLGTGDRTSYSVPTSVSSTISWSQIACGTYHTIGIDSATGLAYAWGQNTYGQLGTGDTTSYSIPTSVSSTISWKEIVCGQYHSVGIDASTGLAYAWGCNLNGQLGTGDSISYSVPTKIKTNVSWSQITTGGSCVLGLRPLQDKIGKIRNVWLRESNII